MWSETPEQRLGYMNKRNSDLIAEAASAHLAARPKKARRNFTGVHLHLGTLLIIVGRTLCEEEILRHNPARS